MKDTKSTKAILIVLSYFFFLSVNAEISLITEGNKEGWLNENQPITISIHNADSFQLNHLAFFIGNTDVSSFISREPKGHFIYDSKSLSLPAGTNKFKVYKKSSNSSDWEELGSVELNILSKGGFKVSKFTPSVEINAIGEVSQSLSGDTNDLLSPDDSNKNNISSSITIKGEHKRTGGLEITSNANFVSASRKEAALRFGEKGNKAPKVDLSEYIVSAIKGKTTVQLGHVSQGNHPLLVDSLSNRGLMIQRQITDRVSVGLSIQSGREITGSDNLLGFTKSKNRISTFTVGLDLLKREGGAKLEVSYIKGSTVAESNFDEGQVPTAEKNIGYGLRLTTNSKSGKLTTDTAFARSKYTNPTNETLEFNGEKLVDVKETSSNAFYTNIGYQLLSEKKLNETVSADLSVNLRYAQTDSEYKSLAAFPNPDERLTEIGLTGRLGLVEFQFKQGRSRDNIENIDTILTTQTNTTELALSTSLKEMFGVNKMSKPTRFNKLLPNLSLSAQKVRQYALNSPKAEDSDFSDNSHLPDQLNLTVSNTLEWDFDKWSLGYTTNWSDQDNKQIGRENADFNTLDHQVSLGFRPKESVTLGVSAGRVRSLDKEQNTKRYDNTYGLNLDWKINDKFTLSADHTNNKSNDSVNIEKKLTTSSGLKLSYQFELPTPSGRKLPGQAFVRYIVQDASNVNKEQDINSDAKISAVYAGVNFSF